MELSFSKSPQEMSWNLGVLNNSYFILRSLSGLLAKIWGNMIHAFCMFFQIVFTTLLWMIFNDFSHVKPPSWQMIVHSVKSSQIIWTCKTQINSKTIFLPKERIYSPELRKSATLVIQIYNFGKLSFTECFPCAGTLHKSTPLILMSTQHLM